MFDAPTASKRGQQGAGAAPDDDDGPVPDSACPDADLMTQGNPDTAPELHPRTSVVQRFKVAMARAQRPPWLPWHDPRFQAPDQVAKAEHANPDSHADGDEPPPPASYAHAVYLGVGPKQHFVEFILRTHAIESTDDELYRPATGRGWLVAFITGATGLPLPRTNVAASFGVGCSLLQQQRWLDQASATLEQCCAAFDERMAQRRQDLAHDDPAASLALVWDDLLKQWAQVHQALGGTGALGREGSLGPDIVIESVPLYRRKDGTLNRAPEQAAAFLNSFYMTT